MTQSEILDFLQANQDKRGIANWKLHSAKSGGLTSFGIGLTELRKFAKSIKRNSKLAKQLWQSQNYEMRIIALLIDDPKSMTIEQVEIQVEQLQGGYLEHVFSSCGATLAKVPFARELTDRWINGDDPVRRQCGYGLLYEISKNTTRKAPDEAYFLAYIEIIDQTHQIQTTDTLMSMATALMGIGKRSKDLNTAALMVAKKIGPIAFDPEGRCDPFNVVKHLSSDYVRKKLQLP